MSSDGVGLQEEKGFVLERESPENGALKLGARILGLRLATEPEAEG